MTLGEELVPFSRSPQQNSADNLGCFVTIQHCSGHLTVVGGFSAGTLTCLLHNDDRCQTAVLVLAITGPSKACSNSPRGAREPLIAL